ncbi:hypothetical protein BS47DRAFT_905286 [Hydnum rufescens UP504]|uniref:Uncharacterized protein n=1 Tax=Hydnum rufescens UP504 TaxID=1448309 RepID=A0A9P6ACB0_9AGAM|nr:hypothetical protein BS47DRAFT_905286 [Hydnum rufescens UP504]
MTPSPPVSQAFFPGRGRPHAATVVSNLRYLVLEAFRGGDLRLLSLFCNWKKLVLDLTPGWSRWLRASMRVTSSRVPNRAHIFAKSCCSSMICSSLRHSFLPEEGG